MSTDFIAGVAEFTRRVNTFLAIPVESLDKDELIALKDGLEQAASMTHDVQLRIIAHLQRSGAPVALGGTPLAFTLSRRLGISQAEARRWIDEATELGYG
jgi:hypothetical protein